MLVRPLLLILLFLSTEQASYGQMLADTLYSWQGYSKPALCGIQLFKNPSESSKKYTVVLTELAENTGPTTTTEIGYLAEAIGRTYHFDPTMAFWVIHWGDFSYSSANKSNKELFIRATFRRTASQRIGAPQWRIISREDVENYTDRQFLRWNRK